MTADSLAFGWLWGLVARGAGCDPREMVVARRKALRGMPSLAGDDPAKMCVGTPRYPGALVNELAAQRLR